jgi:hypothetical protein
LVTTGDDKTARVWDARIGAEACTVAGLGGLGGLAGRVDSELFCSREPGTPESSRKPDHLLGVMTFTPSGALFPEGFPPAGNYIGNEPALLADQGQLVFERGASSGLEKFRILMFTRRTPTSVCWLSGSWSPGWAWSRPGVRLVEEKPGQTLQATALVHEGYLRMVDAERAQRWNSRGHFFAAVAEMGKTSLKTDCQKSSGETTSPPARVISAARVGRLMLARRDWT